MKNFLFVLIALFGFASIAFALPYYTQTQGLVPGVTNTYYIGTSTPSTLEYKGIFVKDLTVSGTCTGCGGAGGTPGGSDTQIQFNDASAFGGAVGLMWNKTREMLGIGTTTPQWMLQIASSTASQFALSDPSAGTDSKHFVIRSAGGNLYIATSTDSFTSTSSPAISINPGSAQGQAFAVGINTANPTQSLHVTGNSQIAGGSFIFDSGSGIMDSSTQAQKFLVDSTNGLLLSTGLVSSDAIERMRVSREGWIGLGTTTPKWQLQLASSTEPQFALSDGSLTSNHWVMRNAGGLFYLATSSPSTFATSSVPALSINANGFMGIGTVSPSYLLDVAGTVRIDSTGTLLISTSSSPTLGAQGAVSFDTTSNNIVSASSTSGHFVVASATTTLYALAVASTSADFISGGVINLPAHYLSQVATAIICDVDGGTSWVINLSNEAGTSDTNQITCTTTSTQFALTTNNSFAAYAVPRLEGSTITGTIDRVTIRIIGYRTSD